MTECSIVGCRRPAKTRGWCRLHYVRWQRHGDPMHVDFIWKNDRARILSKIKMEWKPGVKAEHGPCWTWQAFRDEHGYAKIGIGRQGVFMAYRVAYELLHGPIPEGLHMDHFACNGGARGCVNPFHVRPVTPRENVLRADGSAASINAAKTHCPAGHPYVESTTVRERNGARKCRTCIDIRSGRAVSVGKE